jgi:hypothetical protein
MIRTLSRDSRCRRRWLAELIHGRADKPTQTGGSRPWASWADIVPPKASPDNEVNCGESYTGRPKSNAVENEGKGDIRPTWTLMAAGVASNQTDMRTRWRRWEELEVLDKTVVCWGGTAYLGGNMENRGRQIDSCSL